MVDDADHDNDDGKITSAPLAQEYDSILIQEHVDRRQLNRRQVIVGAISLAAIPAAASEFHSWNVTLEADPLLLERSIIVVTFGYGATIQTRRFREIAFGDRARAHVTRSQMPSSESAAGTLQDLRLTITGLELARTGSDPEFFELVFEFLHRGTALSLKTPDAERSPVIVTTKNPAVRIFARGWIFGPSGTVLMPHVSLASWLAQEPFSAKGSTKLANALRTAVFGERLSAPRDGSPLSLSIKMPTQGSAGAAAASGAAVEIAAKERVLCWILSVATCKPQAKGGLAILTHPAGPQLTAACVERSRLLWAQSVEIWREVPMAAPRNAGVKPLQGPPGGTAGLDGKPSTQRVGPREAFDDVPRTIGELQQVQFGDKPHTVLAKHPLGNGQASYAILEGGTLRPSSVVQLTRLDRSSGKASEVQAPEVRTVAYLSGDLTIEVGRAKKAPRHEGPFTLGSGQIELSGRPDALALALSARFDLRETPADVSTAHGSMVLASPEEKSREPGRPVAAAPVHITAENWRLQTFELTARVYSVAVALQTSGPSATPAADGTQAYGVELTFPGGTEVLYRLHGLSDDAATRPGIGRISLGWAPATKAASKAFGDRFSLPLEGGELKLLRWRDLAVMTYRFAGIDLVYGDEGSVLKPRGLARAQSAGHGSLPGAQHDPRPIMVVELPPQHVAEEAFFEQRVVRPSLPAYPLDALGVPAMVGTVPNPALAARQALDGLRQTYLSEQSAKGEPRPTPHELAQKRLDWRIKLRDLIDAITPETKPVADYKSFRATFAGKAAQTKLPKEQKVYVGPEFLDAAARLVAEGAAAIGEPATALFDDAPDDPVPLQEQDALRENAARKFPGGSADAAKIEADVQARLELLRSVRDPFFLTFKTFYDKPETPPGWPKAVTDRPQLQVFKGATALRAGIEALRRTPPAGGSPAISDAELAQVSAFVRAVAEKALVKLGLKGVEEPANLARARLSGTSRLAFRLNTDDFERPGGAIPFSLDELTNWSRHELAVVRRAEKTFEPYDDLSRRPAWDRVEDLDLANQLLHQGFSRAAEGGAAVSAEQRLAEASAFAAAPPSPFETAIEMPFRLFLSPAQDGRFRTRREIPKALLSPLHSLYGAAGPTTEPLWTAELRPDPDLALRAIWSPDFRPEALMRDATPPGDTVRQPRPARRNRAPLRGPYAPWAVGRDVSTAKDFGDNPPPRFRTSLDAFDRHELVTLTSVHGLPVMGRLKPETNSRIGLDQREPPPRFQVATSGWDKKQTSPTPWLDNDVYVPRRLDTEGLELALSALGGFLRVNASFEPPASILDGQGEPFFDALSIERWRHRIVLGRDISAEVVYKGYLFPLGNRCTLVKITERRFQKVAGRSGPVAVLRQRMLLRVGKPEKGFPAFRQADDGRRVPFTSVKIVTTTTPDLVDPFDQSDKPDESDILPSGLIQFKSASRGAAFWPRTARRRGGEVKFDILVDGTVPIRMPLIFVDNAAANHQGAIDELCRHYNGLGASGAEARALGLVKVDVNGAMLTYAPEKEAGDTRFETLALTFGAEGRPLPGKRDPNGYDPLTANQVFSSDAFMQGADQPPFYPVMRRATIKLAQVERLTTQAVPPAEVAYDAGYAINGFPAPVAGKTPDTKDEIFLAVLDAKPPSMAFGAAGDRGGAVGRPELPIKAVSRTLGPVGTQKTPQAPTAGTGETLPAVGELIGGKQTAADFFDPNAKLLGLVKFSDILRLVIGSEVEPKLREITEFAGGAAGAADRFIRENVLIPIKGVLAGLQLRLDEKQAGDLTTEQVLEKVYPDVLRTFRALVTAIDAALAAPPAEDDVQSSLAVYTGVYTAGRSFVAALERVLRDPVTPLREAGRKVVDDATATVLTAFDEAAKKLDDLRRWLTGTALREAARDILRDDILKPLKGSVFALPLPAFAAVMPTDDEEAVAKALSAAIDAALDDPATWPGVKDPRQPFFDANAFRTTLLAKLKPPTEALKVRIQAEADAIRTAAEDQLRGLIWSETFAIIKAVDDATKGLQDGGLAVLQQTLGALDQAGRAIGAAHGELLRLTAVARAFEGKLTGLCQTSLAAVDDFVHTIVPLDDPNPIDACVSETPSDCAKWVTDSDRFRPFALAKALVRLRNGVSKIAATGGALDVLEAALRPGFPQLAEKVAEVRSELRKLVATLDAAAKPIGDTILRINVAMSAYRRLSAGAATQCGDPAALSNALERRTRALARLDDDRRQLTLALVDTVGAVWAFLEKVDFTAKIVNTVLLPGEAIRSPKPDDDPSTWVWVTTGVDLAKAEYAQRTVDLMLKEVLGLVLPVAQATGSLFQATSSAGAPLLRPTGGSAAVQARFDRREALEAKLLTFRDALGGASDELSTWLTDAHKALQDRSRNSFVAAIAVDLDGVLKEIEDGVVAIRRIAKANPSPSLSDAAADLAKIRAAISPGRLGAIGERIVKQLLGAVATSVVGQAVDVAFERRVLAFLAQTGAGLDEVYAKVLAKLTAAAAPLAIATAKLGAVFVAAADTRDSLVGRIDQLLDPLPEALRPALKQRLADALYARSPAPVTPVPPADGLRLQATFISDRADILANGASDAAKRRAAEDMLAFVRAWSADRYGSDGVGPNPFLYVLHNVETTLQDLVRDALRGDLSAIIDLGAIKQEVERRLRGLIPARVTLAYDLDTEVQKPENGLIGQVFVPEKGTRLTLKTRTVIDLLKGGEPKVSASGELGPFALHLVGDEYDIVKLSFDGARYGSETGGKFKANVVDVELGKMVEFLQQVSSFLSFSSNGLYVRVLFAPPGIEAGYEMPPMGIALGAVGITNISLVASCVLPFDGTSAMFKVGLSSPETPFLINFGIYGGGGHLALYASPQGIVGFEAAFEFGAVTNFAIGPLKGGGRITSGVFIRSFKQGKNTLSTVEGYVTAAGQASLAMFRFAAMLQIRIGQQPGGALVGTAIFTFSFSMGIRDIKFRIVAHKSWGKGFSQGGGGVGESGSLEPPVLEGRTMLASADESLDTAALVTGAVGPSTSGAQLTSAAICKGKNYAVYQSYFASTRPWRPEVW